MGKVIFDISVSVDGYVNATGETPQNPMGDGGLQLHEWFFEPDEVSGDVIARGSSAIGALVGGRTTYDMSISSWEADGPTGGRRLPLFVLTHSAPEDVPEEGVYTFVSEGPNAALALAREAAGEQDVAIMGGAETIREFLEAGVVDELSLHVVPVLFGSGTRLFEGLSTGHLDLEILEVVAAPKVTHLRYRVVK